jgi:uncharacterized membrane protein
MRGFIKAFILFNIMGIIYIFVEVAWKALIAPEFDLIGHTSLWMYLIGGICGIIIGYLNEATRLKLWEQTVLGTGIILIIEFCSGVIFNVWLGLNLWDYSNLPFNVMGQISLPYAICWFLLCPFVIWFDDFLRYLLFSEERKYTLIQVYIFLFTLK